MRGVHFRCHKVELIPVLTRRVGSLIVRLAHRLEKVSLIYETVGTSQAMAAMAMLYVSVI
jgi:hypothetical protein